MILVDRDAGDREPAHGRARPLPRSLASPTASPARRFPTSRRSTLPRTRRRAAAGSRRSWSRRSTPTSQRGEQSLLFLNRRGFAPLTLCRHCGHRFQCPNCTAWMVEHRLMHRLACHHCGHVMPPPKACPECGEEDSLVACGPGVERIADEVAELFPEARTAIVTSDTIWSPLRAAEFVGAMEAGAIDVVDRHPAGHQGLSLPQPDPGRRGRCRPRPRRRRPPRGRAQLPADPAGRRPRRPRRQAGPSVRPDARPERAGDRRRWSSAMRPASTPPKRRPAAKPRCRRSAGWRRSSSRPRTQAEAEAVARRIGHAAPEVEGMAVFGPAPAPLAMLRGRHRQRLLVHARRSLDVQDVIRDWLARAGLERQGPGQRRCRPLQLSLDGRG